MKKSILLIFVVFLSFSCSQKTTNNIEESNIEFNLKFKNIVCKFIDSVETNMDVKPLLGIENFYYSVKFFKIRDIKYFTIRSSHIFPDYEYFNNSFYKNDTTCMFFYQLNNRNIVIFDFPESDGHGIFVKNSHRNRLANTEYQRIETILKSRPIRPSNPITYRMTFKFEDNANNLIFTKLDSIILPPPYPSEQNTTITTEEDTIR